MTQILRSLCRNHRQTKTFKHGANHKHLFSSVHGLVASVNKSAYVSAKHGLIDLSKTVALEEKQPSKTFTEVSDIAVDTESSQSMPLHMNKMN
ncbi:MAG: hypothetical protein B7Y39_04620 [Bdellovibrio sp. 28-41-41]|nr:MAG: hypothetical protein B7Y39_04620 [Bdellovibrio sp. 28-41-41]